MKTKRKQRLLHTLIMGFLVLGLSACGEQAMVESGVSSGNPLIQFEGNSGDGAFSILWHTVECFFQKLIQEELYDGFGNAPSANDQDNSQGGSFMAFSAEKFEGEIINTDDVPDRCEIFFCQLWEEYGNDVTANWFQGIPIENEEIVLFASYLHRSCAFVSDVEGNPNWLYDCSVEIRNKCI